MNTIVYGRHYKRMYPWFKVKMWTEKKILKPHELFGIFNYYDTQGGGAYGGGGQNITKEVNGRIGKFYQKYPESKNFHGLSAGEPENPTQSISSPVMKFLVRQDKYIKEGFNEEKSFQLAEKDLGEELQAEKYERSLFEGLATSNRTRSLMNVYEQKAEEESLQKVKRLARDLPQFKRFNADLEKKYEKIINDGPREFSEEEKESDPQIKTYEAVSYRTLNMPEDSRDGRGIQKNYALKSERLLNYFHSFAHIKDGISNLSDREIIQQAHSTPQKLKNHFSSLLKKLEKYNVKLNPKGGIDYNAIKDPYASLWIKEKEQEIIMCLMCKDLDFEIPHKINKSEIKNKLLNEIQEEEDRLLEDNRKKAILEAEENERQRKKKINYENYFNILPNYNADILVRQKDKFDLASKSMKKAYSFEEFSLEYSKRYMFDNDLLYETYYYWEDVEEKESRLRELWIKSKKNRIEKSDSNKTEYNLRELQKTNEYIVDLVRNIKRKIDQNLLKNNKHPVFGANYRYYKNNEFMLDSELEFHKIKKFLESSPVDIEKDPEIGYKYKELIELLKKKKIAENSVVKFGDEVNSNYFNGKLEEESDDGEINETLLMQVPGQALLYKKGVTLDLETAVGFKGGNVKDTDKTISLVKTQLVSHFENVIKATATKTDKKEPIKKTSGKKAAKPAKNIPKSFKNEGQNKK